RPAIHHLFSHSCSACRLCGAGCGPGGTRPSSFKLPAGSAAATTATAAATAIPTTAAAGRRFRTRLVDVHGTAVQFGAVQGVNGRSRLGAVGHLDKSEPARLPGVPVGYDANALNGAVALEGGPKVVLGCLVAEVSHENVCHSCSFGSDLVDV